MINKQGTDIPDRFCSQNEPHKFLAKTKKTWENKFKPTKWEEIYEATDIAHMLIALERTEEAQDFLQWLSSQIVYNEKRIDIWGAAGSAFVALIWLYDKNNDEANKSQLLTLIKEKRILNYDNVDFLLGELREHDDTLIKAEAETVKWGCHILSRNLMMLLFLYVTADQGYPHSKVVDKTELGEKIRISLEAMKNKLN